jgi:outer membrane protein assembly factor BamB
MDMEPSIIFNFGFFYAINPNGTLKWLLPIGPVINSSPAIAADGTIYILSYRPVGAFDWINNLYAINPDGTIKWSRELGNSVAIVSYSSPIIAEDGTIYTGSGDGYLYALNTDGSIKWQYATLNSITTSPALDKDGNVYIGSYARFYSMNPDGILRWSFEATPFWITSSAAIGKDGTIYVGCSIPGNETGILYALNPDGTLKWQFRLKHSMSLFVTSSPALDSEGTIYLGDDEYFYAINPDGSLKWRYKTVGKIRSSPAIDADGISYICTATSTSSNDSETGSIYALNNDGTLKWQYENFPGGYSSPAIAEDGTIYVGSNKGDLYSIGESQCPLTQLLEKDSPSLFVLRAFRDKVLVKSTLSNYVSLYYQHASEFSHLILSDKELKSSAARILHKLIPEAQLLLDGGEALLSADFLKDIETLLGKLAVKASPELKATIMKIKRGIREEDFFKQLRVMITE